MPTTRPGLDREESKVRRALLEMSRIVDEAIQEAVESFVHRDTGRARAVVANDADINGLQQEVETECVTTIARQQPMASDLRYLISVIHIATELERIGDYAADISRIVLQMDCEPLQVGLDDIKRLAQTCSSMLADAMAAYESQDVDAARALAGADDAADELELAIGEKLFPHMCQHPDTTRCATHMLWVTHNLERIGDRATNIAERVIFTRTGENVELNR